MYSRQEADRTLRQIESKYDLLKYKVDGWCAWPLLRFSVFYQLAANLPATPKKTIRNKIDLFERMIIASKEIVRLISKHKTRYAVLVQSTNRSERIGELFLDIYFDDLLLDIGSYYKIENIIENHFKQRGNYARIKSDLTLTGFKFILGICLKLPQPRSIENIADIFHYHIQESFGLDTFSKEKISNIFKNFYWSRKLFFRMLKRINPEHFLLTTSYLYFPYIAAAKNLGIEVIEFQHGLIDRYHSGYSWSSYALPYKNKMPIPDKIFLYGDHWKHELAMRGFWNTEIHVVGSPRMDKYRKKKPVFQKSPYTLVITTQNFDTEILINFIVEFLRLAHGHIDVNIIFRLHPREGNAESYEQAFYALKNVQVLLGNESPSTFDLICSADFHLSIYSTCHYEAIGLGIPTVILPFTNHETVLPLIETGYAYLARNPSELLEIIVQNPNIVVPENIRTYFFKPNALENMKKELNAN